MGTTRQGGGRGRGAVGVGQGKAPAAAAKGGGSAAGDRRAAPEVDAPGGGSAGRGKAKPTVRTRKHVGRKYVGDRRTVIFYTTALNQQRLRFKAVRDGRTIQSMMEEKLEELLADVPARIR